MSTQLPRLEARISAQERMTTILHARIEELSQDMTASVEQLAKHLVHTDRTIEARFDKIEATMATKDDIASVRAEMATMEGRMLDAFKQLLTMIDTRLPPPQAENEH